MDLSLEAANLAKACKNSAFARAAFPSVPNFVLRTSKDATRQDLIKLKLSLKLGPLTLLEILSLKLRRGAVRVTS